MSRHDSRVHRRRPARARDGLGTGACVALLALAVAAAAARAGTDGAPFAEADVVRIVTRDADGDERDTSVWIVLVDGNLYVRTNASRWLANIRRGSSVALRLDETTRPVSAEEVSDPAAIARVEAAFREKYGTMQRVMSFFRLREPTVLRLRESAQPARAREAEGEAR
jgi:hypothetical protein